MKRSACSFVATLGLTILLVSRSASAAQYEGEDLFELPANFDLFVYELSSSSVYGGQVVGRNSVVGGDFATIWYAPTGASTDLHPPGFWFSGAIGTDGSQQVGFGSPGNPGETPEHALLWMGTANSVVDLHPNQFYRSQALDVSLGEQVGYGTIPPGYISHALLWRGSADSVIDLHPVHMPSYSSSQAVSTDGFQQIGNAGDNTYHAALWSGTAASFIDLNPTSGYVGSLAFDVMNGQQVGRGDLNGTYLSRALLWTGSAESVINLNPTNLSPWGYIFSAAYGTNGVQQVGSGQAFTSESSFGMEGALLWSGTADSAIDLHAKLPPGFEVSRALSIGVDGVIWGVAREGFSGDFRWHAVKWTPVAVPEPGTVMLVFVGIAFGLLPMRSTKLPPENSWRNFLSPYPRRLRI